MTEYSFPVVDEPLSADQWGSVTRGIGDGILDEGDGPYRVSNKSNANNTVDITTGTSGFAHAIVGGFYHKIDADVTLSIPAVSSTTEYTIALQYDPTRTDLPVKLDVFTGELDMSQGRKYLVLYTATRAPDTLLSDVSFVSTRPRVSPTVVYGSSSRMPPASSVLWGTLALVHNDINEDTFQIYFADVSGWKLIYGQDEKFEWEDIPDYGAWTSPVAGGYKRAIGRRGKTRKLRGRVALTSGTFVPGREYQGLLGATSNALGPGDRPAHTSAFTTVCGGFPGGVPVFARVELGGSGDVRAWVSAATGWVSIDGVEWEVA